MRFITCSYCGKEKLVNIFLKNYNYKKIERVNLKTHYFCCYTCMRKSEQENPNKYMERRD